MKTMLILTLAGAGLILIPGQPTEAGVRQVRKYLAEAFHTETQRWDVLGTFDDYQSAIERNQFYALRVATYGQFRVRWIYVEVADPIVLPPRPAYRTRPGEFPRTPLPNGGWQQR